MRVTILRRTLVCLIAGSLAVGAVSAADPLVAGAAPPTAPKVAPTTKVTPVAIPATTARSRQLDRRQADTNARSRTSGTSGPVVLAALPERSTERFSTVGVTWRPSSTSAKATVAVRTRALTGGWTDWTNLENDATGDPDGAARVGTAPVFVGDSNGVQVRVTSGDAATTLPDLQLSLIDSPVVASDAEPATVSTTSTTTSTSQLPHLYPRPAIVSRAGWGADESWRSINGQGCATPNIDDTIQAAVVHHTAGSNVYTESEVPSIIRGMYAYHVKTQGWCDLGYNFVVDKFGKIWEGRAGGVTLPVHGAHATSWNTNTVGISMIGNYETATPSSTAMESMAKLIAWKLEGYYRDPNSRVTLAGKTEYRIFGHGDVMLTACPGRNIRSRMAWLRSNVAAKIGSYNTPIYAKWRALGGESGWVGSPYVGEAVLGVGRYTRFTGGDLYYNPSVGTYSVRDDIRAKYDSIKATSSPLGWPVSDQLVGAQSGNRVSQFQSGRIYWSSATGAHPVQGGIRYRYFALGADRSRLGLPTADEARWVIAGSYLQKYQGGVITWSSATNAQPLWGGIGRTYLGFSAVTQTSIGLPKAPEAVAKVAGAYVQPFQFGAVYWHSGGGYGIFGATWTKYAGMRAETSRLGLPTSNTMTTSTGQTTRFQHGRIDWNKTTRATTVTYA